MCERTSPQYTSRGARVVSDACLDAMSAENLGVLGMTSGSPDHVMDPASALGGSQTLQATIPHKVLGWWNEASLSQSCRQTQDGSNPGRSAKGWGR